MPQKGGGQPSFDVVIVGAGIAGLCTAIGLAKQGHTVTLLDRAHSLSPVGAGLQIPPNATLALKYLGVTDDLAKDALNPVSFKFRRWEDSSILAHFPAARYDKLTPYWSIQRSKYQQCLLTAALQAGCKLRLAAKVENIGPDRLSVTLAGGEVLYADLIVAADGIKSQLRSFIVPDENVSMIVNPMSAYRAYLHEEDIRHDPILAPFFDEAATNVWTGPLRHVIVYPCGGGLYTVGATHPSVEGAAMEWSQVAEPGEAEKEYRRWNNPIVSRILQLAHEPKQWRLAEAPRLPTWVDSSGRIVLIGDGAHGMLQFLASGAAMATEDAAALTECLSRAKHAADIPALMRAFERSRKWRCEIVMAQARRNGDMIHMPDGEEQENRDAKMAGKAASGIWHADTGPFMDGEFRKFLYEHDVVEHTRKVLDELQL